MKEQETTVVDDLKRFYSMGKYASGDRKLHNYIHREY